LRRALALETEGLFCFTDGVEIDPDTGLRSDGTWCASQRQRELAGEWLKLQELIQQTELEMRVKDAPTKELRARLRSAVDKLSEIERQQRAERERLNKLRFPEQCR
jgi:hypothetical protein